MAVIAMPDTIESVDGDVLSLPAARTLAKRNKHLLAFTSRNLDSIKRLRLSLLQHCSWQASFCCHGCGL